MLAVVCPGAFASLFTSNAELIALIEKVCRSFDDYDGSAEVFDVVRRELLEALG